MNGSSFSEYCYLAEETKSSFHRTRRDVKLVLLKVYFIIPYFLLFFSSDMTKTKEMTPCENWTTLIHSSWNNRWATCLLRLFVRFPTPVYSCTQTNHTLAFSVAGFSSAHRRSQTKYGDLGQNFPIQTSCSFNKRLLTPVRFSNSVCSQIHVLLLYVHTSP